MGQACSSAGAPAGNKADEVPDEVSNGGSRSRWGRETLMMPSSGGKFDEENKQGRCNRQH